MWWRTLIVNVRMLHRRLWREQKLSYGVAMFLAASAFVRMILRVWRYVQQRNTTLDSASPSNFTVPGTAHEELRQEEETDRLYVQRVETERWLALREAVRKCANSSGGDWRGAEQIKQAFQLYNVESDYVSTPAAREQFLSQQTGRTHSITDEVQELAELDTGSSLTSPVKFPLPAKRLLELTNDLAHFPAQRGRVGRRHAWRVQGRGENTCVSGGCCVAALPFPRQQRDAPASDV